MKHMRIPLLVIGMFFSLLTLCHGSDTVDGHTLNADMAKSKYRPVVSADQSFYNEDNGLYELAGNVRIQCHGLLITAATAKVNANTLQVWADGGAAITEGELRFTGDALYAELTENTAWFFGTRCGCERPGLLIHGDNMRYNWQTRIVIFDGHVLWVQKGKNHTSSHLEFDLAKNDIVR
ncbi:MAG: LPS export ABC transporter periplasmic protein LptC [Selenomonas sp.]|uniref:hypothetical protein n=1 Tax=Selenomonas sp. TaxID=2053611 RepID=UPI0025E0744F|nr:hypothetical protein [Selenomonas sp.]MCR5756291.1 LPS export ABC transporter periplasmic protein LptC [Selenomonas sp.]